MGRRPAAVAAGDMTDWSRHLLIFAVTLVGSAAVTPLAMRTALRYQLVDRPAAHKFHSRTTPYLGGAAIFAAMLVMLVASIAIEGRLRLKLSSVAVGGAAVALVGLIDDWRVLNPMPRLVVQGLAAITLCLGGVRLTTTGVVPVDWAITVFVVLAVTNAVNLLDNMDGLSAGTVAMASLSFFAVSAAAGQTLVSLVAVGLAGACLGFLPYNFSPARIFLGDAGTLFLGFVVAAMAIELDLDGFPLVSRTAIPLLIIAVPLFDMVLVVLSRLRGGRRVFRGHTDHSSHRLVLMGASHRAAAVITYAASVATGSLALLLFGTRSGALAYAVLASGAVVGAVLIWRFERVYERAVAEDRMSVARASRAAPRPSISSR